MKKFLMVGLLSSAVAFAAVSRPIAKEELKAVNKVIASAIATDEDPDKYKFELTSAHENEHGDITELSARAGFEEVSVNGQLKFENQEAVLGLGGKLKLSSYYYDQDEYKEAVKESRQFVLDIITKINEKAEYFVSYSEYSNGDDIVMQLELTPNSESAESIKVVKMKFVLPNTIDGEVSAQFEGSFNAAAEIVKAGQSVVTDMYNKLAAGDLDLEDEMSTVSNIMEKVFDDFL